MRDTEITGFEDESTTDPQHARTFNFRGKPLAPYSYNARATLYRLGEGHRLPAFEQFPQLVYMLLTKTPQQMDALRSPEAISEFRLEACAWAERERLVDGKGWDELEKLAVSIMSPVTEAENLVPATKAKSRGK